MTDLVAASQQNQWMRLKAIVLGNVSSPITRRVYNLELDEFFGRNRQEPRLLHEGGRRRLASRS